MRRMGSMFGRMRWLLGRSRCTLAHKIRSSFVGRIVLKCIWWRTRRGVMGRKLSRWLWVSIPLVCTCWRVWDFWLLVPIKVIFISIYGHLHISLIYLHIPFKSPPNPLFLLYPQYLSTSWMCSLLMALQYSSISYNISMGSVCQVSMK